MSMVGTNWLTTIVLLGGRAFFRGSQWISTVALAIVWGTGGFADYAAAMGVTAWLLVVASSGLEKAMLAMAGRRGGRSVPRQLLSLMVIWQAIITIGSIIVSAWANNAANGATNSAANNAEMVLIAAATAYSCSVGVAFVAVAALRLANHQWADTVVMSAIGASHLVGIGLAVAGAGPRTVLGVIAGITAMIAFVAAVFGWLVSPSLAPQEHWLPSPRILGAAVFLGMSEICNMIGMAVAYGVLAASAYAGESSYLYLAGVLAQVVLGMTLYLNRLSGPQRASRAEIEGEASSLRSARRLFGIGFAVSCVVLVGTIGLLVAGRHGWGAQLAITMGMVIATPPVLLSLHASARAEYTGSVGRRVGAVAAIAGFVAYACGVLALTPIFGASGGLVGLTVGSAVQAAFGWYLLRRAAIASTPDTAAARAHQTVP